MVVCSAELCVRLEGEALLGTLPACAEAVCLAPGTHGALGHGLTLGPRDATAGGSFLFNHYYSKWLGFLLLIGRGAKLARPAGPFCGKPQACFPCWLADLRPGVLWGLLPTCFLLGCQGVLLPPSLGASRLGASLGLRARQANGSPFFARLCLELII